MFKATSVLVAFGTTLALYACGGSKPAQTPEPAPTATPEPSPAPTAAASAAPAASASAVAEAPPAPKGKIISFVRAANSGKEDKIGEKDGNFKADGVKDLVFDVDFEGPVATFIVAAVDADGTPDGVFDADTLAGKELFPGEAVPKHNARTVNAGVVLYDASGKIINKPNGGIEPFGEGPHKATMRISSKKAGNGPMRLIAVLRDQTIVLGPVVPGVEAPAKAAKSAPAKKG